MALEVLFTPADFGTLRQRELRDTICTVFDVLRATSSMVTALYHGATALMPVEEIPEALALRRRSPELLLAGERKGRADRQRANRRGPIRFWKLASRVHPGKGRGSSHWDHHHEWNARAARLPWRQAVLVGSFLNLGSTVASLRKENAANILVICSGTFEEAAYEDVLAAGALCDAVWPGERAASRIQR